MKGGLGGVWVGWGLAAAAIAVGWASYGWPGVVLAITVIVFWLLLQFSRSLRVLRDAAGRPLGQVDNAVMLHARVHAGMRLPEVLKLTRSLGRKVGDEPVEAFTWCDAAGDEVRVELRGGKVSDVTLTRAAAGGGSGADAPAA